MGSVMGYMMTATTTIYIIVWMAIIPSYVYISLIAECKYSLNQ